MCCSSGSGSVHSPAAASGRCSATAAWRCAASSSVRAAALKAGGQSAWRSDAQGCAERNRSTADCAASVCVWGGRREGLDAAQGAIGGGTGQTDPSYSTGPHCQTCAAFPCDVLPLPLPPPTCRVATSRSPCADSASPLTRRRRLPASGAAGGRAGVLWTEAPVGWATRLPHRSRQAVRQARQDEARSSAEPTPRQGPGA